MELGKVKRSTAAMIDAAVEQQKRWMAKLKKRGQALAKYLSRHTVKTVQTLVAVTPVINKIQDNEVSRQSSGKKWKYLFSVFSVLAIIAVAIWLFVGFGCQKTETTQSVATDAEIVMVDTESQTASDNMIEVVDPVAETESVSITNTPIPTTTTDSYTVQAGDTLWDISERMTGDPFGYVKIAQHNGIDNPDLIFPGQVINFQN